MNEARNETFPSGTPSRETVLPRLSKTDITERLPSDPTELLSNDEHRQLSVDLAAMAKLRRDAEIAAAADAVG